MKIHLVPKMILKQAVCGFKVDLKYAVGSRQEFNHLPFTERCGKCSVAINGVEDRNKVVKEKE